MFYFSESGWPTVPSVAYKNRNIDQLPQKEENKAMPNTEQHNPELTDIIPQVWFAKSVNTGLHKPQNILRNVSRRGKRLHRFSYCIFY